MSAMNFRGLDLDQNINERCLNSWQDYRGQSFQARMMKAARVHQFAKPLKIEEVPIPTPGPEDVVVRINASGHLHPAGTAWLYDACGRCEFCETLFSRGGARGDGGQARARQTTRARRLL
jgi:hypothetical protein